MISNRWRRSPRLEALESLTLMSSGSARALGPPAAPRGAAPAVAVETKVPASGSKALDGTLHGTFFAHRGSPSTGTVYSLFASGKVGPVGPTFLVGGFQRSGFTAGGAGGGNLVLESESRRGNLTLRLTELAGPTTTAPGQYLFSYEIARGSGAGKGHGESGTVEITLRPIKTNIHGQRVSNPGFFGNSTLTFHSGVVRGADPAPSPVPRS